MIPFIISQLPLSNSMAQDAFFQHVKFCLQSPATNSNSTALHYRRVIDALLQRGQPEMVPLIQRLLPHLLPIHRATILKRLKSIDPDFIGALKFPCETQSVLGFARSMAWVEESPSVSRINRAAGIIETGLSFELALEIVSKHGSATDQMQSTVNFLSYFTTEAALVLGCIEAGGSIDGATLIRVFLNGSTEEGEVMVTDVNALLRGSFRFRIREALAPYWKTFLPFHSDSEKLKSQKIDVIVSLLSGAQQEVLVDSIEILELLDEEISRLFPDREGIRQQIHDNRLEFSDPEVALSGIVQQTQPVTQQANQPSQDSVDELLDNFFADQPTPAGLPDSKSITPAFTQPCAHQSLTLSAFPRIRCHLIDISPIISRLEFSDANSILRSVYFALAQTQVN